MAVATAVLILNNNTDGVGAKDCSVERGLPLMHGQPPMPHWPLECVQLVSILEPQALRRKHTGKLSSSRSRAAAVSCATLLRWHI